MSKDSDAEASKRVAGSLKEAIGKIAGDDALQAEGSAEKTVGNVQPVEPISKRSE